jgi:hypothetical protein
MTPAQINLLSRQTAEAYFADDNMVLSDAIEQAINKVLSECETGDLLAKLAQAEKNCDSWLAQYMARGAVLRAVGAGLSFNPDVDRDLETCARRVYAERDDLARWKREALTVISWWNRIDEFVRKHPDTALGAVVPLEALRLLGERDEYFREMTALVAEKTRLAASLDTTLAKVSELSARVVDAEMEAARWKERVQSKVSAAQGAVEP